MYLEARGCDCHCRFHGKTKSCDFKTSLYKSKWVNCPERDEKEKTEDEIPHA